MSSLFQPIPLDEVASEDEPTKAKDKLQNIKT